MSYRIYLTKSTEAAIRISKTFEGEFATSDIRRVDRCQADGDARIPAIYHGKGFYCCAVELDDHGAQYAPTYELTIC